MRTTVTLEPEVERALRAAAHRDGRTLKSLINELLKKALTGGAPTKEPVFKVKVHRTRLVAGIDPARMNQLADELEDEGLTGRRGIS